MQPYLLAGGHEPVDDPLHHSLTVGSAVYGLETEREVDDPIGQTQAHPLATGAIALILDNRRGVVGIGHSDLVGEGLVIGPISSLDGQVEAGEDVACQPLQVIGVGAICHVLGFQVVFIVLGAEEPTAAAVPVAYVLASEKKLATAVQILSDGCLSPDVARRILGSRPDDDVVGSQVTGLRHVAGRGKGLFDSPGVIVIVQSVQGFLEVAYLTVVVPPPAVNQEDGGGGGQDKILSDSTGLGDGHCCGVAHSMAGAVGLQGISAHGQGGGVEACGRIRTDGNGDVEDGDGGVQRSAGPFLGHLARQGACRFGRQAKVLGSGRAGHDVNGPPSQGIVAKGFRCGIVPAGSQAEGIGAIGSGCSLGREAGVAVDGGDRCPGDGGVTSRVPHHAGEGTGRAY